MRKKIRREYDWKQWEESNSTAQIKIWAALSLLLPEYLFLLHAYELV